MGEDVVRNTLLLSSILPNLVTIKPQANMSDGQVQSETGHVTKDSLASIISAFQTNNSQGVAKSGEEQKENTRTRVRLTEDYVLLGADKANEDKAAQGTSKTLFEVVQADRIEGAENVLERSADPQKVVQQAPFLAARSNSSKHGTGQAAEKQTVTDGPGIYGAESVDEDISLTNKLGFAASTGENNAGSAFREQKGHYHIAMDKSDISPKREDYTLTSGEETIKVRTYQEKEGASVSEKGAFVSAMTHKIEEMVEKYGNRTQPMDMTLRLKINDRESLVVGLKEQGDRVIVEVKSASESLTSLLQSNKEAITRELENKQIYTTINVDPNGEGDLQRRGRRDQRRQNAGKEENEAFTGILDALG